MLNPHSFRGKTQMTTGASERPWAPGERRVSKMVFIGRNLNREELESGFRSCLVPPK